MEKLRDSFLKYWKDPNHRKVILCVLGSLVFTSWAVWPSDNSKDSNSGITQYDTFIPKGFVLVPIEVENFASLEGIVGAYTVVDLYVLESAQPRLVGKNLRMLKSPTTPGQFAVLTKDNDVRSLMTYQGPFRVVVQNPESSETQIMGREKRRVVFERKKDNASR